MVTGLVACHGCPKLRPLIAASPKMIDFVAASTEKPERNHVSWCVNNKWRMRSRMNELYILIQMFDNLRIETILRYFTGHEAASTFRWPPQFWRPGRPESWIVDLENTTGVSKKAFCRNSKKWTIQFTSKLVAFVFSKLPTYNLQPLTRNCSIVTRSFA